MGPAIAANRRIHDPQRQLCGAIQQAEFQPVPETGAEPAARPSGMRFTPEELITGVSDRWQTHVPLD